MKPLSKIECFTTLSIAILVYLLSVSNNLVNFPGYFFCDEAVHAVDAERIMQTGRDIHNERYPLFFRGLGDFALSLSVYLQIPFIKLLGVNEFAVRIRTATFSFLGVLSVFFFINIFISKRWAWLSFIFFGLSPIWLLHSRTGFEYIVAATFYLLFLTFYTLTFSSPTKSWFLIPASISAAACFYSYTPARGWILSSLSLLFFINIFAHLKYKKRLLFGIISVLFLLSPYIYFHYNNPQYATKRLKALGFSFNRENISSITKHTFSNYYKTISPFYWFSWEGSKADEVERHLVPPKPAIPRWMLFFTIIGFIYLLVDFKKIENRSVLAFFLASPFPAILVEVNHQRSISTGTMYIVISLIGASVCLKLLDKINNSKTVNPILPYVVLGISIWQNFNLQQYIKSDVYKHYNDYGFYGLQFGAKELFSWIKENHSEYEQINIVQGTFNASFIFSKFYLSDKIRRKVQEPFLKSIYQKRVELSPKIVWILRPEKLRELEALSCPMQFEKISTIYTPIGTSSFLIGYFLYQNDFDNWLIKYNKRIYRKYKRELLVDNELISIEYPPLDHSKIENLFDKNMNSIIKVAEINPSTFSIHFSKYKQLENIQVTLWEGTTKAEVSIELKHQDKQKTTTKKQFFDKSINKSDTLKFLINRNIKISAVIVTVKLTDWDRRGSPHVAEIEWVSYKGRCWAMPTK